MPPGDVIVPRSRRRIRVRGIVQGVGFRPAMWRLARSLELAGLVRNDAGQVWIEVEGAARAVNRFVESVRGAAPPLCRVESIEVAALPPRGDASFEIAPSERDPERSGCAIPVDVAPCADCLRELQDSGDRRYRYPFINCTSCGPRFTIVAALPYDRAQTTMAPFPLCDACQREYDDPADRRYHAEPNACPACGPKLQLATDPDIAGEDALAEAVRALRAGRIVAVKGAGGFALAVDAAHEAAVARLRERKRRPDKPFAVMVRTVGDAERLAVFGEAGRRALSSPSRPIVLAPVRPDAKLAPSVAPGLADVGVFLPPTPLQRLLAADGPPCLVMTSGNRAGEPIATGNDQARARLADVADVILAHDRAIVARADDSVVRELAGEATLIRRARGYVPEPIPIPVEGPPVLAVGGQQASAVCLASGGRVIASPHIGDLGHPEAFASFEESIDHLIRLVGVQPVAIACDRHPDYRATRWATASRLPRIEVQHHHAHVAACLAEHGRRGPVVGIAFDGTGYGDDGRLWGGEILEVDLAASRRLGHLRPLALLGGEAAIREPWRLACAALLDAGESLDLLSRIGERSLRAVRQLWERGMGVLATGAGRWFDAVASLCACRDIMSYDGQAAAELEACAAAAEVAPYEFEFDQPVGAPFSIDLRPAVRAIARDLRRGTPTAAVSARFHETLAAAIEESWRRARERGAPAVVALTGGCFQNRRLVERASARLAHRGAEVLRHRLVPPNDGGLCIGQAAVASHRLLTSR